MMTNRTSLDEFTEIERVKIQNVYKNGTAASTAEEIALYNEWCEMLANRKAQSEQQHAALLASVQADFANYQTIAASAVSAMNTLQTEALARLEAARNGQA